MHPLPSSLYAGLGCSATLNKSYLDQRSVALARSLSITDGAEEQPVGGRPVRRAMSAAVDLHTGLPLLGNVATGNLPSGLYPEVPQLSPGRAHHTMSKEAARRPHRAQSETAATLGTESRYFDLESSASAGGYIKTGQWPDERTKPALDGRESSDITGNPAALVSPSQGMTMGRSRLGKVVVTASRNDGVADASYTHEISAAAAKNDPSRTAVESQGRVVTLDRSDGQKLGLHLGDSLPPNPGIPVAAVSPDGQAYGKLAKGDVIVSINGP